MSVNGNEASQLFDAIYATVSLSKEGGIFFLQKMYTRGRIKMFFKKWRAKRIKMKWEREEKYKLYNKIYRYLCLHKELLEDPVYEKLFYFCRIGIIAYLKNDRKMGKKPDEELGELLDVLTDIYNRSYADSVEEYKPVVEGFYKSWRVELS